MVGVAGNSTSAIAFNFIIYSLGISVFDEIENAEIEERIILATRSVDFFIIKTYISVYIQ